MRVGGDRGIGWIAGIIAIFVGGAAAAVAIVVYKAASEKSQPSLSLTITKAVAARDSSGRPSITVNFTAQAANALTEVEPVSHVQCFASEQSGRHRSFVADKQFFIGRGLPYPSSVTIAPGTEDYDIEGRFAVRCEITRGDRTLIAATVYVSVPGRSSSSSSSNPGGTADPAPYAGRYQPLFRLTTGISLNCTADRKRGIKVAALDSARLGFELAAEEGDVFGVSSFDAELAATLQFSGELLFQPGQVNSKGMVTARFENRSGVPWVVGTFGSEDGHCVYSFEGPKLDLSGDGAIRVGLEDIPDVDGCRPILSAVTAKAGTVRFVITNNTSGFAQVFVYDADGNYARTTGNNAPAKKTSSTITATLTPGAYDVRCDGPGGLDQSVKIVVQ